MIGFSLIAYYFEESGEVIDIGSLLEEDNFLPRAR
jgi:hypothetical protein